jgi:hypothetical protein
LSQALFTDANTIAASHRHGDEVLTNTNVG